MGFFDDYLMEQLQNPEFKKEYYKQLLNTDIDSIQEKFPSEKEYMGFKKLVEVIGTEFCYVHKDASCFSSQEYSDGYFCFLGFDLHPEKTAITITSSPIEIWDVYATCFVTDSHIEIEACKLPE